ncbi:MAG: C45 family autoproteolytic acyltransferase/hydrolase [Minicystis sp.]
MPSALRAFAARHPKKLAALAVILLGPVLAHAVVGATTRIEPPQIAAIVGAPTISPADPDLRLLGPAYARHRGKILEVRLSGTPEEIGLQHGRLLYPEMIENEGTLYAQLQHFVPFLPARLLIMDLSRVQFRHVDRGMPDERRREIAAEAAALSPDPYAGILPTYHRFVFLHALYDIALSFEHSPLLGCTSFALTGSAAEGGHVILARNFDFEAGPVFDEKKAVFLMREEGRIPYASVAWPGLVGAVSGMNAEGVALVVHGGRAREPKAEGEPVVHTMREVLGKARTTREALAILEHKDPMVSHIVMLADPSGDVAIAERAPGAPMFVRQGSGKVPLTNHFEGPLAADPKNRAVEAATSTHARRDRLDELLANLPEGASVERVVGILRDRKGVGGTALPLGDRRTLDALIATHSVVMDTTARALWVSEGPHLVGRYLRFDLAKLLDPSFTPHQDDPVQEIPADEILRNGTYEAWMKSGSPHTTEHGAPEAQGNR